MIPALTSVRTGSPNLTDGAGRRVFSWDLSGAEHVREQAIRARDACGQLAEPGIGRENVDSFSEAQIQLAAGVRLFALIVRFENALILRVPFACEVETALLH